MNNDISAKNVEGAFSSEIFGTRLTEPTALSDKTKKNYINFRL
jgi:hypothetical protein